MKRMVLLATTIGLSCTTLLFGMKNVDITKNPVFDTIKKKISESNDVDKALQTSVDECVCIMLKMIKDNREKIRDAVIEVLGQKTSLSYVTPKWVVEKVIDDMCGDHKALSDIFFPHAAEIFSIEYVSMDDKFSVDKDVIPSHLIDDLKLYKDIFIECDDYITESAGRWIELSSFLMEKSRKDVLKKIEKECGTFFFGSWFYWFTSDSIANVFDGMMEKTDLMKQLFAQMLNTELQGTKNKNEENSSEKNEDLEEQVDVD